MSWVDDCIYTVKFFKSLDEEEYEPHCEDEDFNVCFVKKN